MTTAARPTTSESCHWYAKDGTPVYKVPRANGEGMRPTTLTDARKLSLLPSVTTILGVLHKEALVQWRVEQAILACLTSKRNDGEPLDDFVKRVLHDERVQEQESDIAKKRGIEMHAALEDLFNDRPISEEMKPWVVPCFDAIRALGTPVCTEKIIVGEGYAGKTDLIEDSGDGEHTLWDFKTTKNLPKQAYPEHRLQLSAYAQAHVYSGCDLAISTANAYISTVDCGRFVICRHTDIFDAYHNGFKPLLRYWWWANNYHP